MKSLTSLAFILSTTLCYAQEIKNIEYYNSLKWKNESSMVVYVDKTYKLPEESRVVKVRREVVIPYQNFYPYVYSHPVANVYYTNGFNMGFNSVYYCPIRFGRMHGRCR